jgi:hypothetical protein
MEPSVENVLVELILNKQSNISTKLKEQADELDHIPCTDPSLGAWLDDYELSIVEILDSPDEYFYSRFPELKEFDAERRKKLADEILEHSRTCAHCRRKVEFDSEFASIVDEVIDVNRDELKELLSVTTLDRE